MNNEPEHHHEVRIQIDRKPHKSPNPTTGDALYLLAKVHEGHELYREVFGEELDQHVHRGEEKIHIHENEHFYSAVHHDKGIEIVVNTEEKIEHHRRLTFDQIVKIAFPDFVPGETGAPTVSYENGPRHKPEGFVVEGQSVKIRNGMVFDVTRNNRS